MKNRFKLGMLALAAASLASVPAHADQVTVSQNGTGAGDLILSFTQTGGSEDLEVDMGPASAFISGNVPTLSNYLLTADLVAAFGSNWDSASDNVFWSVVGDSHSNKNSGIPHYTLLGTDSSGVPIADGNNSVDDGSLTSYATDLGNATATSDSNDHAAIYAVGNTGSYDQESGVGALENAGGGGAGTTPAGGFFDIADFGNYFETQTNGGTSSSALYEIDNNSGDAATDIGTFSVSSSGLSFQAVPEPSTWASIVLGAAALVGFRRRRNA
jgi:hypothetical protein